MTEKQPVSQDSPQAFDFILRLGHALQKYSMPTPMLESTISAMIRSLGTEGQVFILPTGLFVSLGPAGRQQVSLMRVEPGEVNLEKLERLDELAEGVANQLISPESGIQAIDEILQAPPCYGTTANLLAWALTAGALSRLLGGGWREMLLASGIGLVSGLIALLPQRFPQATLLYEPLVALTSALMTALIGRWFLPVSPYETILAGLIVVLPGIILTTAVIELATRNLVSGAARLIWAVLIFLEISFGVTLGLSAVSWLAPDFVVAKIAPLPLPRWTEFLALLIAPLSFAVIFSARRRYWGWILMASAAGYLSSQLAGELLGYAAGGFAGALAAGLVSHLFSRISHRPSLVVMVPALLLLLPGSIGFSSLYSFMEDNSTTGVSAAFRMATVAISIVLGLLITYVILPPIRRNKTA
jgi:uncharacterized membrane protein YjjP (DUF1212 family)